VALHNFEIFLVMQRVLHMLVSMMQYYNTV